MSTALATPAMNVASFASSIEPVSGTCLPEKYSFQRAPMSPKTLPSRVAAMAVVTASSRFIAVPTSAGRTFQVLSPEVSVTGSSWAVLTACSSAETASALVLPPNSTPDTLIPAWTLL
jgi:hypothetical protein